MPEADNVTIHEVSVPVESHDDYAEQIKAYRKEHHMLQRDLAQIIGVKQYTLRSWEQKQAKPPYHKWRLLKRLFDNS